MENKVEQFLEKIKQLPKEIDIFFSSNLNVDVNGELIDNYNINRDSLDELIYDFFISDFQTDLLPKLISDNIQNIPEDKINNFISDFLGKLFLPVEPFLEKDISSAIEKHQGQLKSYQKYIDEFNDLVDDKNSEDFMETLDYLEENFSAEEEESVILNILEQDLLEVLQNDDSSGVQKINGSFVYLLVNKKDSQNKFIKALMANQQKLGSKKISFSGQEHTPTFANWMKHFIFQHGSEMFSNIILAKYLTSSQVNSALEEGDKKVLRKLLKTYRNLMFFPDSMVNVPVENWEILPIDRDSEYINKEARKNNKGEASKKEQKKLPDKKIFQKEEIIAPMNLSDQELNTLQEMLKKYPNKSLERKAIESEIKKRKK